MLERMTLFSIERPKLVIGIMVLLTLLFGSQFPKITIDTDPENMLEPDQADRVTYNQVKKAFGIHDLIVVGIVDEEGIFRPDSLERMARATTEILKIKGVIIEDVVSLTTTNNVKSSGGMLDIHPVMNTIPQNQEEIDRLRREIADNPFLHEKIASNDGTALALYVPIQEKKISFRVSQEIEEILQRELLPGQTWHFAGLPVAEDTFGHEMFVQMAVVAPLAFMTILLLALCANVTETPTSL